MSAAVLAVAGVLFGLGLAAVIARRDLVGRVAGLGVLLLAGVVAFAGLAESGLGNGTPPQGGMVALALLVAAAAEVAVGVGLAALVHRRHETDDTETLENVDV